MSSCATMDQGLLPTTGSPTEGTGHGYLTDWICTVETQRDKCEAMCKHYQHHNLADTDHKAHPSLGALF